MPLGAQPPVAQRVSEVGQRGLPVGAGRQQVRVGRVRRDPEAGQHRFEVVVPLRPGEHDHAFLVLLPAEPPVSQPLAEPVPGPLPVGGADPQVADPRARIRPVRQVGVQLAQVVEELRLLRVPYPAVVLGSVEPPVPLGRQQYLEGRPAVLVRGPHLAGADGAQLAGGGRRLDPVGQPAPGRRGIVRHLLQHAEQRPRVHPVGRVEEGVVAVRDVGRSRQPPQQAGQVGRVLPQPVEATLVLGAIEPPGGERVRQQCRWLAPHRIAGVVGHGSGWYWGAGLSDVRGGRGYRQG
jgi:hypothetical protein